jgi:hypothetical protein
MSIPGGYYLWQAKDCGLYSQYVCKKSSCNAGFYDNGIGTCVACPLGKYQDQANSFYCNYCPAGSFLKIN